MKLLSATSEQVFTGMTASATALQEDSTQLPVTIDTPPEYSVAGVVHLPPLQQVHACCALLSPSTLMHRDVPVQTLLYMP